MEQSVSQGIRISVEPEYNEIQSSLSQGIHIFSYTITVENMTDEPVRLVRRKWFIIDTLAQGRIVDGEGVVGRKPMLHPGESFTYQSACDLKGDFGAMFGFYTFHNMKSNLRFTAQIPRFRMEVPRALN